MLCACTNVDTVPNVSHNGGYAYNFHIPQPQCTQLAERGFLNIYHGVVPLIF